MKKLQLDLDTLRVDSFQTAELDNAKRGTVRGQEAPVVPAYYRTFSRTECHTNCSCPITY
jgi:hypothetical protein